MLAGLLIAITIVLPLASAENKTIFTPGENVTLYFKCISNNGGICDGTVNCNITTISPNDSIIVSNAATTNASDSSYYYNFGELNETGIYQNNIHCQNDSDFVSSSISFEVSDDYTAGLIILLAVMSFIFGFYSFKLEQHLFLQFTLLFFSLMLLLFITTILEPMVNNTALVSLINAQYYVLLISNILVFIYFTTYFIYNTFKNKNMDELDAEEL